MDYNKHMDLSWYNYVNIIHNLDDRGDKEMTGEIWVCDICGKQCKTDSEHDDHIVETGHKVFTIIIDEVKRTTILSTVIDINDEVLDKIADRVVEKLIKREIEVAEELRSL